MKTVLVIIVLLSLSFGAGAQGNVANVNASPQVLVFTPSSGGTQQVSRVLNPKRRVKVRAREQALWPENAGGANRLPLTEPRRDLHLIDMRIQPALGT